MRTDRVHGEKCQPSHLGTLHLSIHLSIAGAISSCHLQRGNQAKKVRIPRHQKQCTWTFLNSCRSELGPRTRWLCFSRPISHSKPSITLLCFFFFFFFVVVFISFSFLFLFCLLCPILLIDRNTARQVHVYWFTFSAIMYVSKVWSPPFGTEGQPRFFFFWPSN